ncbi:uncharacterized protein V6R79_022386 [Siganus canaliculatus]
MGNRDVSTIALNLSPQTARNTLPLQSVGQPSTLPTPCPLKTMQHQQHTSWRRVPVPFRSPRSAMSRPQLLVDVFFMSLWILVDLMPGVDCTGDGGAHVLLLRDEQSPKCFTRTGQDFTCFFETADGNKTYDLFYTVNRQKRCDLHVQRTDEGTFLHVCSFPTSDIFFYVGIDLLVEERSTNGSVLRRTVSIEDHFLPDPPAAVSLQPTGAGQLQVSWRSKLPLYFEDGVKYKVRYSSRSLGETTVEVQEGGTLDSLPPGELVQVQVAVKSAINQSAGHWSGWSRPVAAVAPQHADDVSLLCFTSDLQSFSCQWNGSRYGSDLKLYYQSDGSAGVSGAEWSECVADVNVTNRCRFPGNESGTFRVKLGSSSAPLRRTFFTDPFSLCTSIKMSPPSRLRGALHNEKLCLKWDAPPLPPSAHLQYEVGYQVTGGAAWMTSSLQASESSACVEVPRGRYSVRVRVKPTGSVYWSDWSGVFTGEASSDTGLVLLLCVPVALLITAVVLISLFPSYLSKLKLLLWPPLPNLDKVLEGFLTEVDRQRWNPPLTVKLCPEEATSSVVVVVVASEDEASGLGKPAEGATTQLLSPESSFPSRDQVHGHPGPELFLDYVTLNKDSEALDLDGGVFVDCYEEGLVLEEELLQTRCSSCSDGSVRSPSCSSTDFLNQSYLALAESVDGCSVPALRGPGNLYTNLPGS